MVRKSEEDNIFIDILNDIVVTISDSAGINEPMATQLANKVVQELQERYGSKRVYIHAKRWQKIKQHVLSEWNGNNLDELVDKYKISKRRIYQILNQR